MMMNGKSINPEAGRQDWRAQLAPDLRQKIVNRIAQFLKRQTVVNPPPDFLERINILAKQFEEKTFQTSNTKDDYVRKINQKIRSTSQNAGSSHPPGQSSGSDTAARGSDNVPGFSSNTVGNTFERTPPSNIYPSSQGMPVSSQSCQSTLGPLPNNILFQQNQQSRQQHSVSQCSQQENLKLNVSNVSQQSFGQQSDASVLKLEQKIDVPQSHAHQHSTHMLQQGGFIAAELNAQKVMQPLSDSHNQGALTQQTIQQRPAVSATSGLHQQPIQPNRLQSGTSTASNESNALVENANMVDQDDICYQKLQDMKRHYAPPLLHLRKQFMIMRSKATVPEQHMSLQKHLKMIERFLKVLALEKSQLTPFHKEMMDQYPRAIVNFINAYIRKKPTSTEQTPQHFQPPSDISQMSQPHQNRNAQVQIHPTSLQTSSTACSVQPGVPNPQPNVYRSQQYGSVKEWEHKNLSRQMQQPLDSPLQSNTLLNAVDASFNNQSMVPPPNLKQHVDRQNFQLERQHIVMQNTKAGHLQGIEPRVNPHQTHVASPQMSQNYSLLLGQKTLPSVSKSGTPLQSVASPAVSSSTPLTPYSILLNQERECSGVSPTMMSEENRNPTHSVNAGLVASPILPDSTYPNGNQQSSAPRKPVERLIKAVERLSAQELSAAFDEISSVADMVDMFAGSDSRGVIGENLGSGIRYNVFTRNFSSHARDMMHETSAIKSDISFSIGTTDGEELLKHQLRNFNSNATSGKRKRTLQNDSLLDEIKSINQSLVETRVGLDSDEDSVTSSEANEGAIVRCSYNAVSFSQDIKRPLSLMFTELSLRLFVPPNYPNSSPVILDRSPVGWRHDINDSEDLLEETMSRFVRHLRSLSEPPSLGDMARSWDYCARAVIFEKAKLIGGECFSSRRGSWESCITA